MKNKSKLNLNLIIESMFPCTHTQKVPNPNECRTKSQIWFNSNTFLYPASGSSGSCTGNAATVTDGVYKTTFNAIGDILVGTGNNTIVI